MPELTNLQQLPAVGMLDCLTQSDIIPGMRLLLWTCWESLKEVGCLEQVGYSASPGIFRSSGRLVIKDPAELTAEWVI